MLTQGQQKNADNELKNRQVSLLQKTVRKIRGNIIPKAKHDGNGCEPHDLKQFTGFCITLKEKGLLHGDNLNDL